MDGGALTNTVYGVLPGLGDADYPGFNGTQQLAPRLAGHRSIACEILRRDASLYGLLLDRRTQAGTTFARCIRPGVIDSSCTGVGAVACDEECYETFAEFFDLLVRKCHGEAAFMAAQQRQASNGFGNMPMNSMAEMEPCVPVRPWQKETASKYMVSCTVVCRRNVHGYRFPPACGRGERVRLERLLVDSVRKAMNSVPELRGSYFPLKNSNTWSARPEGMTTNEEAELAKDCLLFCEPQDVAHLASGVGRHWPEARGVCAADSRRLGVFINEDDHICLLSTDSTCDLGAAYKRAAEAICAIESGMEEEGESFARNRRWGILTTSPMDLGVGMQCYVTMRLPLLQNFSLPNGSGGGGSIEAFCERLGLRCGPAGPPATWKIWNCRGSLAQTAMQVLDALVVGCEELAKAELTLEKGGTPQLPPPCDSDFKCGDNYGMSFNSSWNGYVGDWNGRGRDFQGRNMDMSGRRDFSYQGSDFNNGFNRHGSDFGNGPPGCGNDWGSFGSQGGDWQTRTGSSGPWMGRDGNNGHWNSRGSDMNGGMSSLIERGHHDCMGRGGPSGFDRERDWNAMRGNDLNGRGDDFDSRSFDYNGRGGESHWTSRGASADAQASTAPRSRPWSAADRDRSNDRESHSGRDARDRSPSGPRDGSGLQRDGSLTSFHGNQDRSYDRYYVQRSGFELREIVRADLKRWQAATGEALLGNASVLLKQVSPQLTDDEVHYILGLAAEAGGLEEASACDCNALFAWIFEDS
eukprot:TRINITY_DN1070_c0_g3_i1.p1 TRINITY_DN1070_c0_g3~~TRINITY_DN1070_c0_g3_i1.p1  ORF type:complete len:773 (-),score=173.27 TRINITY_DN1070_c0_g3_i1:130-2379(-)